MSKWKKRILGKLSWILTWTRDNSKRFWTFQREIKYAKASKIVRIHWTFTRWVLSLLINGCFSWYCSNFFRDWFFFVTDGIPVSGSSLNQKLSERLKQNKLNYLKINKYLIFEIINLFSLWNWGTFLWFSLIASCLLMVLDHLNHGSSHQ